MEVWQPLRRESDGRFDMTAAQGDLVVSVGYCSGWSEDLPEAEKVGEDLVEFARVDREARRRFRSKYHQDGHEFASGAYACWQEFLVDNKLRFLEDPRELRQCLECKAWTPGRADFHGGFLPPFPICVAHQKNEVVLELLRLNRNRS